VTFLAINAAVIVLRFHSPQLSRPFRVPLSLAGIPVLPCWGALTCIFPLQLTLYTLFIGAALLTITLGVSYLTLQKKD
jgi:amino acid transporter